jgi:hypothetical protein
MRASMNACNKASSRIGNSSAESCFMDDVRERLDLVQGRAGIRLGTGCGIEKLGEHEKY